MSAYQGGTLIAYIVYHKNSHSLCKYTLADLTILPSNYTVHTNQPKMKHYYNLSFTSEITEYVFA